MSVLLNILYLTVGIILALTALFLVIIQAELSSFILVAAVVLLLAYFASPWFLLVFVPSLVLIVPGAVRSFKQHRAKSDFAMTSETSHYSIVTQFNVEEVLKTYRQTLDTRLIVIPESALPAGKNEMKKAIKLALPYGEVEDLRRGYIELARFISDAEASVIAGADATATLSRDLSYRWWAHSDEAKRIAKGMREERRLLMAEFAELLKTEKTRRDARLESQANNNSN